MENSKPIIVNNLVDNGSIGYVYQDDTTGSVKFFNYDSLCYARRMLRENAFVLDTLNNSDKLEKVFGCGTFFKLKNDQRLFTYMNNSWGCAGTGVEDTDDSTDSWAKYVNSEIGYFPNIVQFKAHEIWQIHDKYSYRPGFGLKTYFIDSTRSRVYVSGFVNNEAQREPIELLNTEFQIKTCGDVEYGGFLYLLTNGDLYYWGDNDKNFFTSTIDRDCSTPIKLGEKIDNIYILGTMCIYEKEQKFYCIGYARDSYSKYILGGDTKPNVKYPFPGKQLTHLPFSAEYKEIKSIVPLKYNVAVLLYNGELYLTGRRDKQDDEVSLIDDNCDKILCHDNASIAYSKTNDFKIYTSDRLNIKEYMIRAHKYHPSIGVLF